MQSYTPPRGTGSTKDYDRAIRLWAREKRWRAAMLAMLRPLIDSLFAKRDRIISIARLQVTALASAAWARASSSADFSSDAS